MPFPRFLALLKATIPQDRPDDPSQRAVAARNAFQKYRAEQRAREPNGGRG